MLAVVVDTDTPTVHRNILGTTGPAILGILLGCEARKVCLTPLIVCGHSQIARWLDGQLTIDILRFVVILRIDTATIQKTNVVVDNAIALAVDKTSEELETDITSRLIQACKVVSTHLCEITNNIREVDEVVLRRRDACLEGNRVLILTKLHSELLDRLEANPHIENRILCRHATKVEIYSIVKSCTLLTAIQVAREGETDTAEIERRSTRRLVALSIREPIVLALHKGRELNILTHLLQYSKALLLLLESSRELSSAQFVLRALCCLLRRRCKRAEKHGCHQ